MLLDHNSWQVNIKEWQTALRPVLPMPVPKLDYRRYGLKLLKFFRAFAHLPTSPRFPLNDPSQMEHYTLVVVGSDKVWNLIHP